MQSSKKWIFIALEGVDKSGKSTVWKKLKEEYGDSFVFTKEPGGSDCGKEIRRMVLELPYTDQMDETARMFLFWADRRIHMLNVIIPALDAGKIVITDRFDGSTYAYQVFKKGDEELKKHFWLSRDLTVGDYKPNLYLLFDTLPQTSIARSNKPGEKQNHYDKSKLDELEKRRDGFWEFTKHVPHEVIITEQPESQVYFEAKTIIDKYIAKRRGSE
ncbi:MAG: dTMP kinase [Candidatus Paceibacterota bacterium]|jgi:dTMP kinase